MPTPIGHALAGVAAAWTVDPRIDRRLTWVAAALGALPDVDLLLPVQHRTVTHSVGAAIVVTIIAAAVTGQVTTRRPVWRVALVCGLAYASHLPLDWLGVDHYFPFGLTLLWPFSDRFYISGWDIFLETARQHLFTWPTVVLNLQAMLREIALLGPVVLAIWLVRVKPAARLAAEVTRRHHAAQ